MEGNCLLYVLCIIVLYSFINAVHCDCEEPPNIPHGKLKPEFAAQMTFAVTSTVKYDCQPGFIRIPGAKNYITCLENSTWSSTDKFCQSVVCEPPPTIPNGVFYPVKEEYYFTDAVKYECSNPNMVMEYDSSVFCMDNGNWSDPQPSCLEVNCEPPNVLHSRKLSGFVGPYTLNSLVRFECNNGFKMEGSDTIVCNMDSRWKPSPPQCKGAFCPEPKLSDGKVIEGKKYNGYKVDDSVTLVCDLNYKLNGASKVTCGTDFQWSPKMPICELGKFCPEPKLINGKISQGRKSNGYNIYDSLTLACNSGYKLNGEKRVNCQTDYQWTEFPICELIKGCRSPIIANGRVTFKDGFRYNPEIDGHGFSVSNEIDIECDSGYRLVGSSQSSCTYEKQGYFFPTYVYQWLPRLPTCRKIATKPEYDYGGWY